MSYWAQSWTVWVSAFCVVAVYSYLYRDNPLYRTMVQVFIGIQVGYNVIVQWRDILYPQWWLPMLDGLDALFLGGPGSPWGALWVFVGLLGLCWYFQLSRKHLWLSRIVIGVMIGIGAGITFKTQLGTNIPQIVDSFRPLAPAAIGPQPVREFELPAASIPVVLDGELAFFVANGEAVCAETLSGSVLWRSKLPWPPSRSGIEGGNLRLEGEGGTLTLQRGTGAPLAPGLGPPATLQKGHEVPGTRLSVTEQGAELMATDSMTGEVTWRINRPPGYLLFHESSVLAVQASSFEIIDLRSGRPRTSGRLPSLATGAPVAARMKEPAKDGVYAVVPLEGGTAAVVLQDEPALSRRSGEVLWTSPAGAGSPFLASLPGALIASGRNGGAMLQLPEPVPLLAWSDYLNNWLFVFTVVAVMSYFLFSFKGGSKPAGWTMGYGRWALMIAFGAFFGNTVMTRMSYLLDRLMFLVDEWLKPFFAHLLG